MWVVQVGVSAEAWDVWAFVGSVAMLGVGSAGR